MRLDDDDRRQFGEYFAARHIVVRRTAYLLCGDWHWADDLTQATFIKVAAGWQRVRDQQALDAYTRTCLLRTYLSETRRVWRRRERPYAEPPDTPFDDDGTERMLFAAALSQLPPRRRATIICRYYQGMDVAATAAALGCSEGTVKSQTAKALAALRVALGDAVPALTAGTAAKEGSWLS
ncbi:SigE family RNA polymerase sigma factor [Dactylosporangium sp. NPDC049742]|uniref:SigE family RNA polymerase sigma factor n=1 Tax=Dactylosporangium sp. NPDC049742 TaxID=3154737 RepID=UPI003438A01F